MRRLLRSLWRLAKAAAVVAAVVAGLVWLSKRRAQQAPAIEPPVWPPLPLEEPAATGSQVSAAPASVAEVVQSLEEVGEVVEGNELVAVEEELVSAAAAQGIAEASADAEIALAPDPVGAEPAVLWVLPKDGGCPDGYPVKAKVASRIYHVPGGTNYARTSPDRCYATPEDAEADGFRPAKR